MNSSGNSEYCEVLTVTVGVVPSAPSGLARKAIITATELQIEWTVDTPIASNPATLSYRVYLDDKNQFGKQNNPKMIYDSGSAAIAKVYNVKNLAIGKSYTVTVRAVNVVGESVDSNKLELHAGTVPVKITSLLWETSTSTSITIRWMKPSSNGNLPLLKYTIYSDPGQKGVWTPTVLTDAYARTKKFDGLTTGELVDFKITSSNVNGESVHSDILTLYVADKPSGPSQVTETSVFLADFSKDNVAI